MEKEKKGIRCSYAVLVIILFAALAFVTDYAVIERKTRTCDCPKCSISEKTDVSDDVTVTENQDSDITFLTDTELKFDCDLSTIKVDSGDIILDVDGVKLSVEGRNAKYVYTNGIMSCDVYNLYFLNDEGYLFQIGIQYDSNHKPFFASVNLVASNIKGVIETNGYEIIDNNATAYYMKVLTNDGSYNKIYWDTLFSPGE